MRKKLLILIGILLVSGFVVVYLNRVEIKDYWMEFTKKPLPKPITIENINYGKLPTELVIELPEKTKEKEIIKSPPAENTELPSEINLAVPFTSQAPFANWDLPYKEACEEAAVLMVSYFYNKKYLTPNIADAEILNLVNFQKSHFGFFEDTNAEQTAEVVRKYYGFKDVKVVYGITIEDIKKELALGYPVIVPAAGRLLPNPYFRQPGPLYHMLVIKGYMDDGKPFGEAQGKFITNDPGTKRGADFLYRYEDLYNAIHDWNNGDVYNGRKAMIVIINS